MTQRPGRRMAGVSDAEIVARAIGRASAKWNDTKDSYNGWVAAAVVAALTDAGRWDRVRRFAASARAMMRGEPDHMTLLLYPGDLDAEP